jgi:hypothetical protein
MRDALVYGVGPSEAISTVRVTTDDGGLRRLDVASATGGDDGRRYYVSCV